MIRELRKALHDVHAWSYACRRVLYAYNVYVGYLFPVILSADEGIMLLLQ